MAKAQSEYVVTAMRQTHTRRCWPAMALLTAVAAATPSAMAAVRTWNGAGTNWQSGASWTPSTIPTTGDDVFFSSNGNYTLHFGSANQSVQSITFDSTTTSNPYNIYLAQGTSEPITTARTLTLSGATSPGIKVDAGSHTLKGAKVADSSGDLFLGNGVSFSVAANSNLTLDARIRQLANTNNYSKTGLGTLVLSANNGGSNSWTFSSASTGFSVSGGVLRFAATGASGNSGNKFVVASGAAIEAVGGVTQTLAAGTITLNGTGVDSQGAFRSTSGNNTIGGSGAGGVILASATSIGVDADMLTINPVVSGASGLTKVGLGTLRLAAANTYAGGTNVNAGTLLINGNQSAATGAVTVANGATLGGIGTVGGAVTVDSGGILSPGASIGMLSVPTATINGALLAEYDASGSGSADTLAVSGLLSLTNTSILDLNNVTPLSGAADDDAYVIATYGSLEGTFNQVVDLPSGYTIDYSYDGFNGGNSIAVVIPEPASLGLLAVGIAGLVRRRRI